MIFSNFVWTIGFMLLIMPFHGSEVKSIVSVNSMSFRCLKLCSTNKVLAPKIEGIVKLLFCCVTFELSASYFLMVFLHPEFCACISLFWFADTSWNQNMWRNSLIIYNFQILTLLQMLLQLLRLNAIDKAIYDWSSLSFSLSLWCSTILVKFFDDFC